MTADIVPLSRVDWFAPALRHDPYAAYARLREEAGAVWSHVHGCWIVSRYDDVASVLRDSRVAHWGGAPATQGAGAEDTALARWLRLMDPATHSRLRALSAGIVGARAVPLHAESVTRLARQLVARARAAGRLEVVAGYAEPIALHVAGRVLGLAPDRLHECAALARAAGGSVFAVERAMRGSDAAALLELLDEVATDWSADQGNGGLAAAVRQARLAGEAPGDRDVAAFLAFFLFAAFENITNFIGNAVLALAAHPAAFAQLTREPSLVPGAVEELLRYDSPVQFMLMTATAPLVVGPAGIRAGDGVLLGLAAGNRDPRRFADPDRLDVCRTGPAHLGFGAGPLTCVGAALARFEGQAAVGALAEACGTIAVVEPPVRRDGLPVLRGLASLRLELR